MFSGSMVLMKTRPIAVAEQVVSCSSYRFTVVSNRVLFLGAPIAL